MTDGTVMPKWKWSEDCKCYYWSNDRGGGFDTPPRAYCLGERHIHADFGLDSYGILWRGSTVEDWHGLHFGYDLKSAIEWIQQAEETGHEHWTGTGGRRLPRLTDGTTIGNVATGGLEVTLSCGKLHISCGKERIVLAPSDYGTYTYETERVREGALSGGRGATSILGGR